MKRSVFIGMVVIYLFVFLSKRMELYFPELINNYLTDLLCMPIVLSTIRYGIAYWINDASFRLGRYHMIVAVVAFIIAFEMLLPTNSHGYTADPIDGVMYSLGALIYSYLQTPTLVRSKRAYKFE